MNPIISKFIPGGQSIATLENGKKAFFWNALPGEIVTEFNIVKERSSYLEAIATKIENPSNSRVEPHDPCFLATSPWQILDYSYELEVKKSLIVEQFRQNQITIDLPEIVTDNKDYFYRNKMEYALYFDKTDEIIKPAFHTRGSHHKFVIDRSSIERPEIFEKANEIIRELNAAKEPAYKYQSMLLRCDQSGKVEGGLFENHKPHPVFPNLTDTILGHEFSYSPNGFFQINLPVYELALLEIAKHIESGDILDLYSGVGTIGLSVTNGKNVTLVESNHSAYNELENNCKGFKNAHPIYTKSEDALSEIKPNQTVIVDPPRAGCDVKLIEKLLEIRPTKIIYLSCNPATQARDIALLTAKYHLDLVKLFNFFPHTPHIESLAILS